MEDYKKDIESHDIISFDIFDTLLARNVAAPIDVFSIAHELFNQDSQYTIQDDVRSLRVIAERNARHIKTGADVSLDDIYRQFELLRPDYPIEMIEGLKEFEIKTESSVLIRNTIAELYDYARSINKKVAIISDMYIPKTDIERLLRQNGIDRWDLLIVSCDDDLSKASGTAYVSLKDNFKGMRILHFGDNYHDDIENARRHGIDAIHIKSNVELMREIDVLPRGEDIYNRRLNAPERAYLGQVQQSIIDGIVANYSAQNSSDTGRLIGFGVLGPLLMGFCQWLHESLRVDGCDKVLFLARDGRIMQKAYNAIYGDSAINSEYIYGSRRALVLPSLNVLEGGDIRTFAQLDRGASLAATLEIFNLKLEDPVVMEAAEYHSIDLSNDTIDDTNAAQVESFLLSLKDLILKSIEEERSVVKEYLDSVGFGNKKDLVAVCDIGWNGSVRSVIENYVGRNVPGYYLGLRNVDKTIHVGSKIKGYFDARKEFDWKEFAPVIAGGVEVLELLFSNPDQGPIKKIIRGKDGDFLAPENAHDFSEDRREMVRNIQEAAMEFIEMYQKFSTLLPRSLWLFDRHAGLSNVVNLIDQPSARAAEIIGGSPYSTSVGSRPEMVGYPTRSNYYYRTHWRALKKEWEHSFWGQGFKKNAETKGLRHHGL